MAAVWLRFRAELRTRWRSWLVLALLVAVGAGIVIAAFAGARRTESAYSRFLISQRADDVIVVSGAGVFGFANLDLARVARLPDVADSGPVKLEQIAGVVRRPGARPTFDPLAAIADRTGTFGKRLDRPKILEGRRPDPTRPNEVAPSFGIADRLGLRVGSPLSLRFYAPDEGGQLTSVDLSTVKGPLVTLKVVGISAAPGDFPPVPGYDLLRLTPAFDARYGARIFRTDAIGVRLTRGTGGVAAFKARVERLAGGEPVQFFTQHDNAVEVQRSIHVQAVALYVLVGLAGVIALLVIAQAVTRQAYLSADDDATLAALGLSRRQLGALVGLRLALVGGLGVTAAIVLAIALSPLTPLGLAGKAEPDPGVAFDTLALGAGAALAVVLVAGIGVVAALRAARASRRESAIRRRPSALVGWLAGAGAPPTAVVGVRMAVTHGRGRGAVPVWSTVAGGVLAVTTVVGAVGFGASLDHLLATPRLYGVGWTLTVGDTFAEDLSTTALPKLRDDPDARDIAGGTFTEVVLGGRLRLSVLATQPIVGDVTPTVLEGHAPASPDEILLGTRTMNDLGAGIGSSVPVTVGSRHARFRVVGRGVLPDLGSGGLGRGAALTFDGLRRLVPGAPENIYLVRVRRGVARSVFADGLEQRLGMPGLVDRRSSAPSDLVNFGRVDNLPFVVAGLLALMAVATLTHTLVSQVRRRRRDLAVLKTLGFERRQVLATTAWQASTLVALALFIGIPLGILVGRVAWRAFADQLGVVDEPRVAWLPIMLLVPAVLLLANLIAAFPARSAARTRPAIVLRSE